MVTIATSVGVSRFLGLSEQVSTAMLMHVALTLNSSQADVERSHQNG